MRKTKFIAVTLLLASCGALLGSLAFIRGERYPVGSAQDGVPRPTLYVIDTSGAVRPRATWSRRSARARASMPCCAMRASSSLSE